MFKQLTQRANNMLITRTSAAFHWMQKVLGLAPYMVTGDTYTVLQAMSFYTVVILVFFLLFIYYCAARAYTMPGVPFSSYVTCIAAALSLFQLIFRQKAAVNAHNELISATHVLKKFTQINYERLDIARIIEFVFSSTAVVGISVYMVQSSEDSKWYICMAVIYAMVVRVVLVNQFTWMTHAININLSAVNELLTREPSYMFKDLTEISHLHERFTACGEITNTAFSMALFCWTIESFMKICYCAYHLCACALYPEYITCGPAQGESAFGLVWYLVQFCYTVRLCQLVTSSVTNSSSTIHEILRNVETTEDVTDKLEKLSYQLVPRFFFSATGFFILDYPFLTTLAGLVTAYVIIFVQFFVMDNGDIMPDMKTVHALLDKGS